MDWQKGEYQTLQIMWSTKPHNDRLPPLQVHSFTSDSYRAIKEREGRRCQRKKTTSQQQGITPHIDVRGDSASLDKAADALSSCAELDGIMMSHSRMLQPVAQEDCRLQLDGESQQDLYQSCAQRTGPVEVACEGTTSCIDAFTSSISPPIALDTTFPEHVTETELGSDFFQAMDPSQGSTWPLELDIVVPSNADTAVEKSGSELLQEMASASPNPSYLTPTYSVAAVCKDEPGDRAIQDGKNASPRLASPRLASDQPNTELVLAATAEQSCDGCALTEGLLDAQGDTGQNHHNELRTCLAGFDQASRISGKRGVVPQALWTKDLDEYLLHLRDEAELKWRDLVDYFPTMTLSAVKRRHQLLSDTKSTAQGAGDQHATRLDERRMAAFRPSSTPGAYGCKITKHNHATLRQSGTNNLVKWGSHLRRRCETRPANHTKGATAPALPNREGTPQRSSRCGRPIRHPFRNRPIEGYL